jgi:hypothetical protein
MNKNNYLQNVRRALFDRGVWGAEARRITEQLTDHYLEAVAARRDSGEDATEAEEHALGALGSPDSIAEAAAGQIQTGRWIARHPWLLAGGGVFVLTFAVWGLVLFGTIQACQSFDHQHPNHAMHELAAAFINWLPFSIGCGLLAWWGRKSTGSWQALLIASGAVGLATSCLAFKPHPHSDTIVILGVGWVGWLLKLCCLVSPDLGSIFGSPYWYGPEEGPCIVKMLLPVLAIFCARYIIPRMHRTEAHGHFDSVTS